MTSKIDRKKIKPVIEKRRRSRINQSLSELKSLVLKGADRETTRYAKLEKADILELAVEYIKSTSQMRAIEFSHLSASRYNRGYERCASEIAKFLRCCDGIDSVTKGNIMAKICKGHGDKLAGSNETSSLVSNLEGQRIPLLSDLSLPFEATRFKVVPYSSQLYGFMQVPCPVAFIIPQQTQIPVTPNENLDTIFNSMTTNCSHDVTLQPKQPSVWRPWEKA